MKKTVIAIFLTSSLLLSGCFAPESFSDDPDYHGEDIEPVVKVDNFTLYNATGEAWNFAEMTEGKVVVIAFLFTNCIDICPIVTENLRWTSSQLTPEEHNSTEFITLTVDPWRDDPATMLSWKELRGTDWSHLSINDVDNDSQLKAITDVWVNFGVGLWIEEAPSDIQNNESSNDSNNQSSNETAENSEPATSARHHPDAYSVNHSTGTVLVDHRGLQQVWWGDNDWFPELVLEDIRMLIAESNEA
ncbi:SCO family protein [Candidatus Poseidoniales archaeon]|jgi:cytochrome oxidase Cu insertion factor (SCO1/SenC/PrrC family)|nr:SCO family protein [Candidatus Poseidoniales archaeon]MDA8724442.1 SCO family protein [Candidatus Poseidoniales archaeon]MDB0004690.1 SCO family protein [Candidatus Poseidoniaceae archaeon]MDB2581021.1 SCO family protein [Candidatus Poseidoniales archaeon]